MDFTNNAWAEELRALSRLVQSSEPNSRDCGAMRPKVISTHHSWLFLTRHHAYKLKKQTRPPRTPNEITRRRRRCIKELLLNQPYAPGVYLDVVPLTQDQGGRWDLSGKGRVVDWLLKMRRLPRSVMLDWQLTHGTLSMNAWHDCILRLCQIYNTSEPLNIRPDHYVEHLAVDVRQFRDSLQRSPLLLPLPVIDAATTQLLNALDQFAGLLASRARDKHVIEGHGDLRPEHIGLEATPVIIDRLDVSRRLRTLDTASELAFLQMECQRFRQPPDFRTTWATYGALCADAPPPELLILYGRLHAFTRAMLAARHPYSAATQKYISERVMQYLQIATGQNC